MFWTRVREHDLNQSQTRILDEYLHDIGVIIHFRDRLELTPMVILQPEWATGAFYRILDWRPVRERGGLLLHSELSKMWPTALYPHKVYPRLLELMNRFELAYHIEGSESHLVAELLPSTPVEYPWPSESTLRFFYHYDFLPAGLMTRLIVRMHRDLETDAQGKAVCWREGAVFRLSNAIARVRVVASARRIEIDVAGENVRDVLSVVRGELDAINSSLKNVTFRREVPCTCSPECKYIFNYDKLLEAEQKGLWTVQCQESWSRVNLGMLLDGYERKSARQPRGSEGGVNINILQSMAVEVRVDLSRDLPELQRDFARLKRELINQSHGDDRELERVEADLLETTPKSPAERLIRAVNRVSLFLRELNEKDSKYGRLIQKSATALKHAQKLAETYNRFAQWLGLPQVPSVFLGG